MYGKHSPRRIAPYFGRHHISGTVVVVIYISILFIFSNNDHVTFVILKKNDKKRYPFVLAAAKEILINKFSKKYAGSLKRKIFNFY